VDLPAANGFCNDIAVDAAGNAYITDTNNMSVDVLKKGASKQVCHNACEYFEKISELYECR